MGEAVDPNDNDDHDGDDRAENGEAIVLTKPEPGRGAGYLRAGVFIYGHEVSLSTLPLNRGGGRHVPDRECLSFISSCGATRLPLRRASERPIAIACFRLLTFRPLPDLSVPRLRLRMAPFTSLDALREVFAMTTSQLRPEPGAACLPCCSARIEAGVTFAMAD
jgi:hypothetical protein